MTGTKRGWCKAAFLGLAALVCWLLALFAATRLTEQYRGLSVRFGEPAVSQEDLKRAAAAKADGEIACAAAWTSGAKLQTASSDLGGEASIRLIRVYGDMRQVAPMQLLAGSFPLEDDAEGCLLDAASAWKLFHASDAVGAAVTLNAKSYLVRGIVKAYEPMMLIRSSNGAYENLELNARDLSAAKQPAETFLYRCNAAGTYTIVQNGLLARIALGCVWFCACLFGAGAAIALWKSAWAKRANKRLAILRFLVGAALAAAVVALLLKTMYWPQSFLPTKWSDFGFWFDFAENGKTQWKAISLMTPHPKEIQLFSALRRCGVLLLAALLTGGWCATSLCSILSQTRLNQHKTKSPSK